MCFAVENVFSEMMTQDGCQVNMTSTKGAVNAVICVEDKKLVHERLEQFVDFLEEQLHISCFVVCGECLKGGKIFPNPIVKQWGCWIICFLWMTAMLLAYMM